MATWPPSRPPRPPTQAEIARALQGRLHALAEKVAAERGYSLRDKVTHCQVHASAGAALFTLTRGSVVVWCKGDRDGTAWVLDRAEAHKEFWLVRTMVMEVDAGVNGVVRSSHTA
jgi:hypothetical protein